MRLIGLLPKEQWQRNQYIVVFVVFLNFLGFTFVMPFLPLYVMELGVTDVSQAAFYAGLASGAAPATAVIMNPVWGWAADRFGRQAMLIRSLVGFTILMFCMSLVTDVYQLLAVRIAWGFAGGFVVVAMSLVTLNCPKDRIGRGVGMLQTGQIIGWAIGPALGGLLADSVGLRHSFYVPILLYLLALVITILAFKEPKAATGLAKVAKRRVTMREAFRITNFWPIVVILFVAQFVDKSFGVVLPLFVASVENANAGVASYSGLIVSLGAMAAAVSASVVGRLSGRYSPWRIVPISLIGGALACLPMAFVDATWQFMILRILLGLLAGGTITLVFTIAGLSIAEKHRTTAFGLLSSAGSLGNALGPAASGVLAAFSLRAAFLVDGLLFAVALMLMAVMKPGQKEGEEQLLEEIGTPSRA